MTKTFEIGWTKNPLPGKKCNWFSQTRIQEQMFMNWKNLTALTPYLEKVIHQLIALKSCIIFEIPEAGVVVCKDKYVIKFILWKHSSLHTNTCKS